MIRILFTLFIVLLLAAGITLLFVRFDRGGGRVRLNPLIGVGVFGLGLVLLFFSCFTIVEAKTQGVLLTFGKPSERTLDPGPNFKLPWQSVIPVDTTRQTDNYNNGTADTDHSVLKVRLGNGNVSDVYASVTWTVNEDLANTVYGDFRSDDPTEQVYKNLVAPNFKQAVNSTLGTYNPTAEIASLTEKEIASPEDINLAPDFDQLASDVSKNFIARITPTDGSAPLINVLAVQVSYLEFDPDTQAKISQYQDEVQKTIIAKQAVQTAIEQALANDKISASISKDPNVLVSRCFDLIRDGAFVPPAGFSCWSTGGSAVVVPSAPK